MSCIVLLTDFGFTDTYVGTMKGVIKAIHPQADVIDLTHSVRPQDVRAGAFALATTYTYFPPGSIFVVVVDPGVGSARRPLVAKSGTYFFVGPDNGVLSYALRADPSAEVRELVSTQHCLAVLSRTFHGRDVFAPAAAYLAQGISSSELGPAIEDYVRIPSPKLNIHDDAIHAEVVTIDHFGNVVTSIGPLSWVDETHLQLVSASDGAYSARTLEADHCQLSIHDAHVAGIAKTYADVPVGMPLLLAGSSGYLELAINQGDAAKVFAASPGQSVYLQWS